MNNEVFRQKGGLALRMSTHSDSSTQNRVGMMQSASSAKAFANMTALHVEPQISIDDNRVTKASTSIAGPQSDDPSRANCGFEKEKAVRCTALDDPSGLQTAVCCGEHEWPFIESASQRHDRREPGANTAAAACRAGAE
jgi:hypothetical protein